MLSTIGKITEKVFDLAMDKKITRSSFLYGVQILSSIIILLLYAFNHIPIQLEYENPNLLNYINFIDNVKIFDDRCVYWVLILGLLLFWTIYDKSYDIAKKINSDQIDNDGFLKKWTFFLTVSDAIEIIYSIYYLLLACNKLAQYLSGSDYTLPTVFAIIHLGSILFFAIYNSNYVSCQKSKKWEQMSPYCDSNGKTLYSEMKVFYEGKAYRVMASSNGVSKEWNLISSDLETTLSLDSTDYSKLLVAQD